MTAGPQALSAAPLATPTGLAATNGGCRGGNTQTNVSLAWNASALRDANGGYLINNYTGLRSTTSAGVYASVGTTSGSPPAAALTDVNPTGATTPQVFVGNDNATNTVHAVNSSTNAGTSIATGTIGIEPNSIAGTPDGATMVVAEGASHQVQIVAVATDTVSQTVAVPTVGVTLSRPDAVAITPDGLTAYVVDMANNLVYPLTIATGTFAAGIAVGTQGDPGAVVITPDGTKLYVANFGSSSVTAITVSSNTVAATIAIGGGVGRPIALATTPDSAHVFVADQAKSQVDDIATSSNMVRATITVGAMTDGNFATGGDPNILAITPNGTKLYVASYTAGQVADITVATDTVATTITLPVGSFAAPAAPNGLALTPNGCQLFINDYNNNQVDVVTVSTDLVAATPTVGATGDPIGMSVSPDSTHVYVANYYDGTVSVIATATNTASSTLATATVGANPYAVLVTDSTYYYKVQAGHGGWRSALSPSVTYRLAWNQGGWQ